jgi:hypothetical protein
MSENEVLYCYGVVENGVASFAGEGVFPVPCESLAVLARRVPREEFGDEKLQSVEWLSRRIAAHDEVLRRAMEGGAVIPWQFGALFSSEERVKETLRGRADEFSALLGKLKDREEWTVRGLQEGETFLAHVRESSRELQGLREQERVAGRGTAYLIARRRELLESEEVHSRLEAISQEAARYLEAVVKIVPLEAGEAFFKVAALVDRSSREELKAVVERLNRARGLRWSLEGPFPPYHFVEERP